MRYGVVLMVCMGAFAQNFPQIAKEAETARDQNQIDDAVRLYRECVRLRPSWSEGWWYLGTLLYDKNSFGEAREALTHFVKLQENAAPGWALLGLSEYETGAYDQSLRHLQHSLALGLKGDPQIAKVVRFHEALLLTYFGQFEMALKRYAQLYPAGDERTMITAIGLAALRMPMLPAAVPASRLDLVNDCGRAVYDEIALEPAEAKRGFERLLAKYPGAPEIHYVYGRFLLTSDPDAAIREWKEEIRISPKHVPARLEIAFEYLKRGDAEKALPYAREAVELEPNSFAARNALGRALLETGDVKAGVAELEKARDLAPDSPETRLALASAYAKAGRATDAARERAEFVRLKKLRDAVQ
jgi:tetratricopeptide (TPR) repeat protein